MSCAKLPEWPDQYRAGLDLGSRQAKLVVVGPDGIIKKELLDAVPFWLKIREAGRLDQHTLGLEPGIPLVATGYGRAALPEGIAGISEIRAHWRGAMLQTGLADFTLVELGGQDSKVVHVKNCRAMDFSTNDRCAAGTGRYLENMATLLGVELGQLAGATENPVEISNTCAIFGESEVLSRLAAGSSLQSIMAGINFSVAKRIAQMVRRYRPEKLVFCGGVAKNAAVVKLSSEITGIPVTIPPEPQFNGALGCCVE